MRDDGGAETDGSRPLEDPANAEPTISRDQFRSSFGEDLARALDVDTWLPGEDLSQVYDRLAAEVRTALDQERGVLAAIRETVFPRLHGHLGAPPGAGVYRVEPKTIEQIHQGLLFNGGVEACDGTVQGYDTLPLSISQIGVSLVSYQGNQGTWSQRLFRRDLRSAGGDPTEEMLDLLERRQARGTGAEGGRRDQMSELARRGIMTYAERAILLRRSEARWRLGHGNPAPYELITGSGMLELMVEATRVIRELVERHQRFVFIPSETSDLMLSTIGQALQPAEFAIVDTLKDQIEPIVAGGHFRWYYDAPLLWDGTPLTPTQWIQTFRDQVAAKVVRGVYRASQFAPAQVFYAHEEHAQLAAQIAIADSILQAHRGFPLLLDVAHYTCSSFFGRDTLVGPASQAYAEAGWPWRHLSERESRYGV
jgi:hypothetical protein